MITSTLLYLDCFGPNVGPFLVTSSQLFAMAEARVGSVPLIEPAEEIRALLLRLCNALLRRESSNMFGGEVMITVTVACSCVACTYQCRAALSQLSYTNRVNRDRFEFNTQQTAASAAVSRVTFGAV